LSRLEEARAELRRIGAALAVQDLDDVGPEAFALAHFLARTEAAVVVEDAEGYDHELSDVYTAMLLRDLAAWPLWQLPRPTFVAETLSTAAMVAVGESLLNQRDPAGERGLTGEHADIFDALASFAADRIAPLAESIHRDDALIGDDLLGEMAELGVFGLSIPEEYGGCFTDHLAVVAATEALSAASLGAGGSVMTRPEICAKALLHGGTEAQKMTWLPAIAGGQSIVGIAVTEPDAGSDVAAVRTRATPVEGGYRLDGEKTWCTFGGRADVLVVLARTGDGGHRGLSLFLVAKPTTRARSFDFEADGGRISGKAIPTVGYRGMHSFAIAFENWFVPAEARIGPEGQGFRLTMHGFDGGRIQTAARAIGVMEVALADAVTASVERRIFGNALADLPLTRVRLVEMAARVQAGRQLAYAVAREMDTASAGYRPSLVKLMTCRDAELVTRDAMQLHGGLGYAEECDASRYWLDARVLSIFEGAEEVLALRVVARQFFRECV